MRKHRPTLRIDELRRRAKANLDVLRPMGGLGVDCERKHQGEATVTRLPR